MNTVPPAAAIHPNTGQLRISAFETKFAGTTAPSATMSNQEMWLATMNTASRLICPRAETRSRKIRLKRANHHRYARDRPGGRTPANTAHQVATPTPATRCGISSVKR
jgi:hypothetical protein